MNLDTVLALIGTVLALVLAAIGLWNWQRSRQPDVSPKKVASGSLRGVLVVVKKPGLKRGLLRVTVRSDTGGVRKFETHVDRMAAGTWFVPVYDVDRDEADTSGEYWQVDDNELEDGRALAGWQRDIRPVETVIVEGAEIVRGKKARRASTESLATSAPTSRVGAAGGYEDGARLIASLAQALTGTALDFGQSAPLSGPARGKSGLAVAVQRSARRKERGGLALKFLDSDGRAAYWLAASEAGAMPARFSRMWGHRDRFTEADARAFTSDPAFGGRTRAEDWTPQELMHTVLEILERDRRELDDESVQTQQSADS